MAIIRAIRALARAVASAESRASERKVTAERLKVPMAMMVSRASNMIVEIRAKPLWVPGFSEGNFMNQSGLRIRKKFEHLYDKAIS
jgi:hypothetical protein